jgi:hypothetical protein
MGDDGQFASRDDVCYPLGEAAALLAPFRDTFDWAGLAVCTDQPSEVGQEKGERKPRALLRRRVVAG